MLTEMEKSERWSPKGINSGGRELLHRLPPIPGSLETDENPSQRS